MKRKTGIIFMVLGAVLIIAALSLFVINQRESSQAEKSAQDKLNVLIEEIQTRQEEPVPEEPSVVLPEIPEEPTEPPSATLPTENVEMTEVEIDGYNYIGYLSIPSLELELPVMADWDYPRLKIAPCRYVGTVKGEDIVIMAHNYDRHFGRLKNLTEGTEVIFVDMDGVAYVYQVVAKDILAPNAVEEMTSGVFDLTLFTCTYGGASRVTIYCDLKD